MTRETRIGDLLVVSLWDTCPLLVQLKRHAKDRKLERMTNEYQMHCQEEWHEPPPDIGEDFDLLESPGRMRLLFVSTDGEEVVKAVKQLLFALVRCLVSREGTGWAVWVQDERDLPRALSMFHLWAKPRPLPPWAALLEHDTPVPARAKKPNGRKRRLGKRTQESVPETAERPNSSVGTGDKWMRERWLP